MRGGGGRYAARLFLLLYFPCSADHERDWPPCEVVFRVGNQYAECEKQQQTTTNNNKQQLNLDAEAKSDAYSRTSLLPPAFRDIDYDDNGLHSSIYRHTPSDHSQVDRVTRLLTDGVHCWESAGTGPVVLKVVPRNQ